jgi:hypothetical protein
MIVETKIFHDNGKVTVFHGTPTGYSVGGPGAAVEVEHPEEWSVWAAPVNDTEAYVQLAHTLCRVCILSWRSGADLPLEDMLKRMAEHVGPGGNCKG